MLLGLVVVIGVCSGQSVRRDSTAQKASSAKTEPARKRERDQSSLAYTVAKDVVKKSLIAPSTAKFPSYGWDNAISVFKL